MEELENQAESAPTDADTLPTGWAWTTVGEILEVTYGKGLTKTQRDDTGDVPVYGSAGITGYHTDALTDGKVIIIGRKGAAGEVHLSKRPCWVIDTAYFVEPPSQLSIDFLFYAFKVLNLNRLDKSTAIPSLSRDDIYAQYLPIPPTNEQRRIVEVIEAQFTRLDAGVEALKRLQANLRRYKAAVLKAACEGRLVPPDPTDEPAADLLARILAERRTQWEADQRAKGKDPRKLTYPEPAAPDTNDLPNLPEGWVWASLDTVAECLDRFRIPVNKKERATKEGDIPYYGANGQVGWIDDYLFDEPLVLIVEDETFTGREKPFSYKIEGKSWVNNHAHVLRAIAVHIDYLNYSLAFYPFTPLTTGTTGRKKLTQQALLQAEYALPPIREQERIVEEIEKRLSITDEFGFMVEKSIQRAERLRQSILKEAFAGRLVAQDPIDEPASELLQRIQQQRAQRKQTKA